MSEEVKAPVKIPSDKQACTTCSRIISINTFNPCRLCRSKPCAKCGKIYTQMPSIARSYLPGRKYCSKCSHTGRVKGPKVDEDYAKCY